MQRRISILIAILCGIIIGLAEFTICNLFPDVDFGGGFLVFFLLTCVPIGMGFAVFIILRNTKNRKRGIVIVVITLFITILLEITIHPSYINTHQNVWEEIYNYTVTFFEYPNKITYDDLAFGNEPKQVAATVKYKDSLPERMAVLTIREETKPYYEFSERYWVELKNGEVSYDHDKFSLTETSDGLLLITNPNSTESREYLLKGWNNERLFDLYQGADISFGDERLDWSARDFELWSGAEKLFYKILSLR